MIGIELLVSIENRPTPIDQILDTYPSVALGLLAALELDHPQVRNTTEFHQEISNRPLGWAQARRNGTSSSCWPNTDSKVDNSRWPSGIVTASSAGVTAMDHIPPTPDADHQDQLLCNGVGIIQWRSNQDHRTNLKTHGPNTVRQSGQSLHTQ